MRIGKLCLLVFATNLEIGKAERSYSDDILQLDRDAAQEDDGPDGPTRDDEEKATLAALHVLCDETDTDGFSAVVAHKSNGREREHACDLNICQLVRDCLLEQCQECRKEAGDGERCNHLKATLEIEVDQKKNEIGEKTISTSVALWTGDFSSSINARYQNFVTLESFNASACVMRTMEELASPVTGFVPPALWQLFVPLWDLLSTEFVEHTMLIPVDQSQIISDPAIRPASNVAHSPKDSPKPASPRPRPVVKSTAATLARSSVPHGKRWAWWITIWLNNWKPYSTIDCQEIPSVARHLKEAFQQKKKEEEEENKPSEDWALRVQLRYQDRQHVCSVPIVQDSIKILSNHIRSCAIRALSETFKVTTWSDDWTNKSSDRHCCEDTRFLNTTTCKLLQA